MHTRGSTCKRTLNEYAGKKKIVECLTTLEKSNFRTCRSTQMSYHLISFITFFFSIPSQFRSEHLRLIATALQPQVGNLMEFYLLSRPMSVYFK